MEVTENVAEGGTVEEAANAPSENTTDTSDYIPGNSKKFRNLTWNINNIPYIRT